MGSSRALDCPASGRAPVATMTASGASAAIRVHRRPVRTLTPGSLHLAGEIGDDAAKLGASGQKLRQQRLAAKPLSFS